MFIKEIILFNIILIFFFYLFNKKFLKIILKYKLIDKPGKYKIHKTSIPVTGGIILIVGLFFYVSIFPWSITLLYVIAIFLIAPSYGQEISMISFGDAGACLLSVIFFHIYLRDKEIN